MDKRKKALVLDDDIETVGYLTMMLEKSNYIVLEATKYAEAERLLLEEKPDVAFLDLYLEEEKSGADLIKIVLKEHKYCKCVIFSNEYDKDVIDKLKALGNVMHIDKMINYEELQWRINSLYTERDK